MLAEHVLPAGTTGIDLSELWVASLGKSAGANFGHEEGLIYYAKTPRIPSFIQRSDEEILGFCGDFGDRRFSGGFSVYFEE
jgi:hypothetical protein